VVVAEFLREKLGIKPSETPIIWETALQRPDIELNPLVVKLVYSNGKPEKYALVIPVKNTFCFHLYQEFEESNSSFTGFQGVPLELLQCGKMFPKLDVSDKDQIIIEPAGFKNDPVHFGRKWPNYLQ
jgi:hypothetical protein